MAVIVPFPTRARTGSALQKQWSYGRQRQATQDDIAIVEPAKYESADQLFRDSDVDVALYLSQPTQMVKTFAYCKDNNVGKCGATFRLILTKLQKTALSFFFRKIYVNLVRAAVVNKFTLTGLAKVFFESEYPLRHNFKRRHPVYELY